MKTIQEPAYRLGALVDSQLASLASNPRATARSSLARRTRQASRIASLLVRMVDTPVGPVRLLDSEADKPCVVLVPDGPNLIEHYAALIARLSPHLRVVCFDMPGFGFSRPRSDYRHTLDQGAHALLGVLDELHVPRATLAFSCANGFYAMRAARLAPTRIASLLLSQTPSFDAMRAWAKRMVPAPLHLPVLGQAAVWLARHKLASRWYEMALPRTADRVPFHTPAAQALAAGAAFSLAGVVQGLKVGSQSQVDGLALPCTMLWGEQDRTHRHTDPDSLLTCAAKARVVRCSGAGHFPDLEQPDQFVALVRSHIEQHAGGAS